MIWEFFLVFLLLGREKGGKETREKTSGVHRVRTLVWHWECPLVKKLLVVLTVVHFKVLDALHI